MQEHGPVAQAGLLVLEAEMSLNEPVVAWPVPVCAGSSVAGDRAVHQPRVARAESRFVDPQPARRTWREALHHHVGGLRDLAEAGQVARLAQVQHHAPLASIPDRVPRRYAKGISARWLHLHHGGAPIGQKHRRHRTGCAPGQVQDGEVLEWHPLGHQAFPPFRCGSRGGRRPSGGHGPGATSGGAEPVGERERVDEPRGVLHRIR